MKSLINKGEHNTVIRKAVPCDLKAEIFKARDETLKDEYAKKLYDMYQRYFDEYNKETYSIGGCINFICDCNDNFKPDVYIYTGERYLCNKGTLQGITKLPNGADIIVFQVCAEESGISICQVLYYDGEKLRLFTPYEGNAVNVITKTCLGDEEYAKEEDFDYSHPLVSIVYPDGLSEDLIAEDYDEEAKCRYMMHYGISKEDAERDNIALDWEAINKEILDVLN